MHRAGQSIQRRVMRARGLIDSFGVGGQLVVEAVEIDSFPSGNEAFDIGPAKIEMP